MSTHVYNVDSPIKHGGKQYSPSDAELNTIELSDKDAKALRAVNAISLREAPADIKAGADAVSDATQQRAAAIKDAIAGLDKDDASLWTADGKADTKVLSKRVGFKVSAAERDAIAAI